MADKLAGLGQYGSVDPEFTAVTPSEERLRIAALNASPGQTAEQYLASRGGINAAGYYGDSWNAANNLTDAEYASVLAAAKAAGKTGAELGAAINEATAKKRGIYTAEGGYNAAGIKTSGGKYDANGNFVGGSGGLKTAEQIAAETKAAENKAGRQSAYDLLFQQFKQYGLESLVEPLKALIQKDISPSQFTIELRNSPEYLKRFAANAARVKAGYKALDEGTYLALEDSYQNLMRNYGLPASYWEKGELGVQPGFEKLIAGNVDPVELEQRLVQAVDQIEKGPKEYMDAIKQFYPEISRSDLLSYVLDPENALKTIQSKVKAAQIGGEYLRAGLGTDVTRASELATQGVTADIARASIPTIMETAKRGGELAGFYGNAGLGLYDQATAEEEIYNLGKAAEAKKKREKLVGLEQASFAGQYGGAQGALDRGRSGAY